MKFVGLIVCFSVVLTGCVTIQTTPESNEVLVEMAARRLTYHVALGKPQMIEPGLKLVEAVLAAKPEEDPNQAVAYIIAYLAEELEDPLLKEDLNDLMRLMEFNLEMRDEDLAKMRYVMAAARGIQRGLTLAGAQDGIRAMDAEKRDNCS